MSYDELMEKYLKIQQENNELKNEVSNKSTEIKKLQAKVLNQELQINVLNRYLFGSKREATDKKEENIVEGVQCSIFGKPEDEETKKQIEEKTETITVHRKKNNKKVQAGIKKAALKDVEVITEEYKLEEGQLNCPVCGGKLKEIGKELVRQEIEYVPAKLILKSYVRYSYKCEACGTENSEKETSTIVKTKTPKALLAHSFASPSLAAEVIYQKYYMGAPLYRQEKMWDDKGLVLPRNMMANWCIKLSQYYFEPLYQLMLKQLKEKCEVLNVDETTIQCNKEPGKKASSNSYMWIVASGEQETRKGVIFYYSKSRSAEIANNLLKGYTNIMVTDRLFRIQ